MASILVVIDEVTLRTGITDQLRTAGHEVQSLGDGRSALRAAARRRLDLVILDLMLPAMDGFDIYRQLHQPGGPAILLIADPDAVAEPLARELDASALLIRPVTVVELLLQVDRLLSSAEPDAEEEASVVVAGDLRIDLAHHRVTRAGEPVPLKPMEMELLGYLARRRGTTCTSQQLLREVWGYAYVADTRTLAVHIHGLREKLEGDPSEPHLIQTVRGTGYRFEG